MLLGSWGEKVVENSGEITVQSSSRPPRWIGLCPYTKLIQSDVECGWLWPSAWSHKGVHSKFQQVDGAGLFCATISKCLKTKRSATVKRIVKQNHGGPPQHDHVCPKSRLMSTMMSDVIMMMMKGKWWAIKKSCRGLKVCCLAWKRLVHTYSW